MFPSLWARRGAPWVAALLAVASLGGVLRWVDLRPEVEGEFFFAPDDPQMAASRALREQFRIGDQVILRVADTVAGEVGPAAERGGYLERVEALTEALEAVEGVGTVYSVATHDVDDPLYGRILATPDPSATNIVMAVVDGTDPEVLVPRIEAVVDGLRGELDVVLSGAPVIVEQIRRGLFRDLIVFTVAAVLLVAVVVGGIYRDPAVLAGTLLTSALAVDATLLSLRGLDVAIGLLTANLATIVFVLCLSHMVFITANVRRAAREGVARAEAVARGVAETVEGSFWGMTTTCLGFLSLLVATARPLRELGVAGAVGAVLAMASAYLVYPIFLLAWARLDPGPAEARPDPSVAVDAGPSHRRRWAAGAVGLGIVALALGVSRLDTEPGLLTYFAPGSELREGLERIDADGGSSPLYLAVRDQGGDALDTAEGYDRLQALQDALEADSRVGVVLGPSVLIDQARTMPLARFLPLPVLLDIASSPRLDEVALGFVTADRREGLFMLRMREAVPVDSRDAVVADIEGAARAAGLTPVRVAGLYDLQARLGHLIAESLAVGIGGLLLLFLAVAGVVSRRVGTTVRMWLCLAGIPLVVLGTFGWLGIAVDIITSPAANVALAVGVDAMIHLVVRARRFAAAGTVREPWAEALARVRGPVLSATGILGVGFGVFVLSDFPPTRRFGLAVILGTASAAALALLLLPRLEAVATARKGAGASP